MKTPEKLLALAEQYEADARSIRRAVELMNGHQTNHAEATFAKKLRGAVKLRRKAPEPKDRRLAPAIYNILRQYEPQSYKTLSTRLTDAGISFTREKLVKACSNLVNNNRLTRKGKRETAMFYLKASKSARTRRQDSKRSEDSAAQRG